MFALLATMHTCANLARKRMTTSALGDGMQREQKPSQTNRNPLCYLFACCSNALTTFVYLAKHLYSRPNGYKLKKDMCPPRTKKCISWSFRPILVIYSAIEAEKWVEFRKIIKNGGPGFSFWVIGPETWKKWSNFIGWKFQLSVTWAVGGISHFWQFCLA